jgi:hypothetical protein
MAGVENHSEITPAPDRSFTARLARMLNEVIGDFLFNETGYQPNVKTRYEDKTISVSAGFATIKPSLEISVEVDNGD